MPKASKRRTRTRRKPSAETLIARSKKTRSEELDLHSAGLTEVPESVTRLTHLKSLVLTGNKISRLHRSLLRLSSLRDLHLSHNRIGELPEWIGGFKHLRHLCLNSNRLTSLPESIGYLNLLEDLQVSNNRLNKLPASLGRLMELRMLFLGNNKLSELPMTLRNLKRLVGFELHGNRSLGLPEEIVGKIDEKSPRLYGGYEHARRILEYYFRVRGGHRPLNEAKLILVGRGGVGKTSLVNRLVHGIFSEGEKKTEGIKITEWSVPLNLRESARLNIWDFGGQEIMHATHQFFLTQRSVYLLVLNGREGNEDADAEYWLKLVQSFGAESPIIVVLNKTREHPFDVNRLALRGKYPAIRGFIDTDCGDGTGINELRKSIIKETDQLEHLRDAFPARWFTIKDRLARMRKTFLSYEEYRNLCAKLGERDNVSQESLAGYLHDLGTALNYKDDPRLQDTHVLNPRWVTNGIYKILNWDKLAKQKGEMRLSDLNEVLDPTKYPPKMHRFLLDLMKKFDLCFTFPDDDTHYLIPELLDKQEPSEASEFNTNKTLNFQYSYPVLPEGLLPRFIVRTHILSEGSPRWRTGVILSFESNRALVKADTQERRVYICISGPAAGRRRLLAIIRSDFERIHRDIRNLLPEEIVPLPSHPDVVVPYEELLVMERSKVTTFPKVVKGKVVELSVNDLLNGVDIGRVRKGERISERELSRVRLFYSYSHKDETLRNRLETQLKLLQRQQLIETWHDRKIEAGDEWKRRIDENLEQADIILLLVSPEFIASDYCWELEMKRALERHEQKDATVIPVILRDVKWETAPFSKLQPLPKDGKAVTKWSNKDTAWRNVSDGIEKVVTRLRKSALSA